MTIGKTLSIKPGKLYRFYIENTNRLYRVIWDKTDLVKARIIGTLNLNEIIMIIDIGPFIDKHNDDRRLIKIIKGNIIGYIFLVIL